MLQKTRAVTFTFAVILSAAIAGIAATGVQAQSSPSAQSVLEAAANAHGINQVNSIQFSGTGWGYNVGQAVRADMPWPLNARFVGYSMAIDYAAPALRIDIERTPPEGLAPGTIVQKQAQLVSGKAAWNQAGQTSTPAQQTYNDRLLQIWATPHGVIRAAQQAGKATKVSMQAGLPVIVFPFGKTTIKAMLTASHLVDRVEYQIDTPMLGDTAVEIIYANYHDFNGTRFPSHILQKQGGYVALDWTINHVQVNQALTVAVPDNVAQAVNAPAVDPKVDVQPIADGVYYITGQSHHSLAVEFKDHVVLFEAPQHDARVTAVFAAVRKTIPNKPVRYAVISHNHFDHAGGLRAAVAEGATIMTHVSNKASFEQALKLPHTISPDRLSKAPKKAAIQGVDDVYVHTDGKRRLELHRLQGFPHSDGMLVAYLPAEKILAQVDSYTPAAAPAATPAASAPMVLNPNNVSLHDNILRLKLDVDQIAAGHGRLVKLADLVQAIGR